MLLSISEIIKTAQNLPKSEKVEWLKSNNSEPLRAVLACFYNKDENVILIPKQLPWKKNAMIGMEGMLYSETRRFKIFLAGKGYDALDQTRREHLFIEILESIDDNDAELLNEMLKQRPIRGISLEIVKEAFPEIFVFTQPQN
jgi:hypothetical protein